jgi:regulator of replication initiation timing
MKFAYFPYDQSIVSSRSERTCFPRCSVFLVDTVARTQTNMSLCKSCGNTLPPDEDYVKCVNSCTLHYTCSGLAEKTWRQWARAKRDTYRCILCRNAATDNSSTRSVDSQQDATSEAGNINTIKSMPLSEDLLGAIEKSVERAVNAAIGNKLNNVIQQISNLEKSVTFCSDKVDDFFKQLNDFSNKVKIIERDNIELRNENNELKKQLSAVKLEVEDLNQYGRNHNILIEGVPELGEENVMNLVNKLAVAVDETIVLNVDIQAAHRIPAKNKNKPRPIVVQFSNRQKRDAVLKKARSTRPKSTDFVQGVPTTNVYVNEHLTPYYNKLFYEAKQIKVKKGYKYLWVSNSKLFIRKDGDSKAVKISCMDDLNKL